MWFTFQESLYLGLPGEVNPHGKRKSISARTEEIARTKLPAFTRPGVYWILINTKET